MEKNKIEGAQLNILGLVNMESFLNHITHQCIDLIEKKLDCIAESISFPKRKTSASKKSFFISDQIFSEFSHVLSRKSCLNATYKKVIVLDNLRKKQIVTF
jgi:hypothetical protein